MRTAVKPTDPPAQGTHLFKRLLNLLYGFALLLAREEPVLQRERDHGFNSAVFLPAAGPSSLPPWVSTFPVRARAFPPVARSGHRGCLVPCAEIGARRDPAVSPVLSLPPGSARAGLVPSDSACVWGWGHGRGSERHRHRDGSRVRDRPPAPHPLFLHPGFVRLQIIGASEHLCCCTGCLMESTLVGSVLCSTRPCPLPRHPHLAPAPIFLPLGTPSACSPPCCWSGTSAAPPSARLRPVPRC